MATFKEVLRRLYHDLVVRRSVVRVIPATEVTLKNPPIFLVGPYRSGTTLLRYILDSHSHIACPPESDFLTALSALVNVPAYRHSLKTMGYDREHVLLKLRELAVYFFGNYAASLGKERWADKTPGYIDCLDFILSLFPEAQFVMIYRHGFDQAHSFTRGGTFMRDALQGYVREDEDLRIGAVRYWREKVERMMAFESIHPDKCFRICYEDLCNDPEEKLQALFGFLNEPWEPDVLEFYKFPHDKGNEDGRVMATRGFVVSKGHYGEWSSQLMEICAAIALPALQKLGYQIEGAD